MEGYEFTQTHTHTHTHTQTHTHTHTHTPRARARAHKHTLLPFFLFDQMVAYQSEIDMTAPVQFVRKLHKPDLVLAVYFERR